MRPGAAARARTLNAMPALFTSTSRRPCFAAIAPTAAAMLPASVTSSCPRVRAATRTGGPPGHPHTAHAHAAPAQIPRAGPPLRGRPRPPRRARCRARRAARSSRRAPGRARSPDRCCQRAAPRRAVKSHQIKSNQIMPATQRGHRPACVPTQRTLCYRQSQARRHPPWLRLPPKPLGIFRKGEHS